MSRSIAVLPLLVALATSACDGGAPDDRGSREIVDLSGPGWRVWIDDEARWRDDPPRLLADPAAVSDLPVNPPTVGWQALAAMGVAASVPGTAEGLLWPERGDIVGVSWWTRPIDVPASAAGRRARLRFDAVRLRAEVFLDGRLVGYDAVGNTPFAVELGDALCPGTTQVLAVRVTDPGGNFDWIDHTAHRWGEGAEAATIPASHGFGGVTGAVRLELRDPLHVEDVFVRNTADPRTIGVEVALEGAGGSERALRLELLEADTRRRVLSRELGPVPPGRSVLRAEVTLPDARLWSPDEPHLYLARVTAGDDVQETRFGFRWFAPEGHGERAVFRLNGRRVVLRSAISWGFWPVTGLVPSRDLADRQARAAKALGLNALNHHRTIAHPLALDASDELGLLAHLEPGGWWCQQGDERARAFAREKWLRMVRANRSRPSVVVLNLGNEIDEPPGERARADLAAAHALDPSRTLTYTSAWADTDPPALSLHVRPLATGFVDDERSTVFHEQGWHDQHDAPGPGCWRDELYQGPGAFVLDGGPEHAILMRGEQAAIAGPPRLALMHEAFLAAGHDGWDGEAYRAWAAGWRDDAVSMGLLAAYGSFDALTRAAGAVAHDHHARSIALARAGDVIDAYVINGWESERLENHSGLVDVWRRPKADPSPLAAANAPTLLVLAPRRHVLDGERIIGAAVAAPAVVELDLYLVDERDLQGAHRLRLLAEDERGERLLEREWPIELTGGERFGRLLREAERLPLAVTEGRVTLRAELRPGHSGETEPVARGTDELWLVDWRGPELPSGGARVGATRLVDRFLSQAKGLVPVPFDPDGEAPRWVLLSGLDPEPRGPADTHLSFAADTTLSLRVGGESWTRREPFVCDQVLERRLVPGPAGQPPREADTWERVVTGHLQAAESGPHRFHVTATLGARLSVDGRLVLDEYSDRGPRRMVSLPVELRAGEPVSFALELLQERDAASYRFEVTPPSASASARRTAAQLVRAAREQGTTVVVLDQAVAWARLLRDEGVLSRADEFPMGRYWMGGGYLARPHPLLEGLPADRALGWEWQALARNDRDRRGLLLGPEAETVVACWSDHQPRLASALAVVPCGSGRFVLNTLDVVTALDAPEGALSVPRRLLCNLLRFAGAPR